MTVRISGLRLRFGPEPQYGTVSTAMPDSIALLGEDMPGLRPRFAVEQGARVAAGDLLFEDRTRPELRYVSPASGTVKELRLGPRRSLEHLLIAVDGNSMVSFDVPPVLERSALVDLMISAGLWIRLRTRPFDRVPRPSAVPDALFVTAMDTRPLSPDPATIIASRIAQFSTGLDAIRRLTGGRTYLCHAAGASLPTVEGVTATAISGAHPAGLAGAHIHHLHPVGAGGSVWHIGYQDVLELGHLLSTGRIWGRRIVGLAGTAVSQPALLETFCGADLHQLSHRRLHGGHLQLMSGSPLDGRVAHYLAQGHLQVSAMSHRPPGRPPTWSRLLVDRILRGGDTIIPNALHEQAAPPGILSVPFLRAIAVGDADTARRLGALELAEEDLALLTYVDRRGSDFGGMLRKVLNELESQL